MKFLAVILGACLALTEACNQDIQVCIISCIRATNGCDNLMNSGGRVGGLNPNTQQQLGALALNPRSLDTSENDAFANCILEQCSRAASFQLPSPAGWRKPATLLLQCRLCAMCVAGFAADAGGCDPGNTGPIEDRFPECEDIHIDDDPIIAQFIEGEEKGRQTCYMMSGHAGQIYTLFEEERQGGFQINVQLERWSMDRDPMAKYVGILSVTEGYFVMTVDLAGLSFIGSSKGMDSMIIPWGQNTFANLTDNVYVDLRHDIMEIQFGEHLSIEVRRRHGEFLNVALDHDDPSFKNVKGVLGDMARYTKLGPDTLKGKGQSLQITDPRTGEVTRSHAKWIDHAGCTRVADPSALEGILLNSLKECGLYCR